jgi:acyloxyacyl hydrolase
MTFDTNCNGIFGSDNNGNKYEETFCSGVNTPKGLVIIGDSATAHFSLPPSWFHPADVNSTDYSVSIFAAQIEINSSSFHLNLSLGCTE